MSSLSAGYSTPIETSKASKVVQQTGAQTGDVSIPINDFAADRNNASSINTLTASQNKY